MFPFRFCCCLTTNTDKLCVKVRVETYFKMSHMQLLKLYISERLSVAAEEIFAAVQRTITEYEQSSDQHGLKQEVHLHIEDMPQVFFSAHEQKQGQEWSPESYHKNSTVDKEAQSVGVPEPPAIKQEQVESWSSPGGQQLPDMEGSDMGALKETPTCITSCIYSNVSELQTSDTGNGDRKAVPNTSTDHRKDEGNSRSSRESWPLLPDCYVSLNNMGPEMSLGILTGYSKVNMQNHTGRNQPTKSCEPSSQTTPNKEIRQKGKYCCRLCGREFSHNTYLATHMKSHTNKKLFICKVCGKELRTGNSLSVHMRIHTEERPYRCQICGQDFRQVGNLNVHMRIHTGEKPYCCEVCGKKFSRSNSLTRHMSLHTGGSTLSARSMLKRGSVGMAS